MSSQIIGNAEYRSIREKAYINDTQAHIMELANELDRLGIKYSGRVSDYKSTITVEASDKARVLEISKRISGKEIMPANVPTDNSIIGNTEYRYIKDKRYIKGDTETMLKVAARLEHEKISFSGRIYSDTVTLTVSGQHMQELVKSYFAEEKESDHSLKTVFELKQATDTFEDIYYISEINAETSEEVSQYRSEYGDISIFSKVDEALEFAVKNQITLINSSEQLNEWREEESLRDLSEQLVDITDQITDKEKILTGYVSEHKYAEAAAVASELDELSKQAEKLRTEIQQEAITKDDVDTLRSITPRRKSIQNMLETEVAKTTKFDKLLGDEMGEKSAYEMRRTDNAWRNDESKTTSIISITPRKLPEKITDIRKDGSVETGTYVNQDTGMRIQFGKFAVHEIVAKAIPDDMRHIPVEARLSAIYQMKDLIKNSICFDSRISEYNDISSKNKSPNTLFIHRLYGILRYNNEYYLSNLAVEEMYTKIENGQMEDTHNRVYSLRDIKITPVKLPSLKARTDLQNEFADEDTSSSVTKISIPQLYDLVKTYDKRFFENPASPGRAERETEIQAHNDYLKAREEIIKENNKFSQMDFINYAVSIIINNNAVRNAYTNSDDAAIHLEIDNVLNDIIADITIRAANEPVLNILDDTYSQKDVVAFLNEYGNNVPLRNSIFIEVEKEADVILSKLRQDNEILEHIKISERNKDMIDKIAIGDTVILPDGNFVVTNMDGDFSIYMENTDPTAKESSKMYFGFWKEQLLNEIGDNLIDVTFGNIEEVYNSPQNTVVSDYKSKTNELFHNINGYSPKDIEIMVQERINNIFSENDISSEVKDIAIYGSRSRGMETDNSDIDIVVEIVNSELKEDAIFNLLNDEEFEIGGVKVDINPIKAEETGTLETYLENAEKYLSEKDKIHAAFTSVKAEYQDLSDSALKFLDRLESLIKNNNINQINAKVFDSPAVQIHYGGYNRINKMFDEKLGEVVQKINSILSSEEKELSEMPTVTLRTVGDFYEIYGKDAQIAADILGITLTRKNGNDMCGFPNFKYDEYSEKLRSAGYIPLRESVYNEAEHGETVNGNTEAEKEIEAGDKYIYNGETYTVTNAEGIYSEDVIVSHEEQTDNGDFVITENMNKSELTSGGTFVGNDIKNEELSEQLSLFGDNVSHSSSDEIMPYTSSYSEDIPEPDKEENSPLGNLETTRLTNPVNIDFKITDENYNVGGGAKTRYNNNVAAIKLMKTIENENRSATSDEQEVLSKYVGWGGIPQAFDEHNPDWEKEYAELKELLTNEEYKAAKASTLNAHFTTPIVIDAIYQGLESLGFSGGKILEPAMGVGNFFGAMPDKLKENSELHGVELDSITGRIAKLLYPSANIQIKGYEETNFQNNTFDVAVGNVPFGSYTLNDKEYNKQNMFIHDYFFAKTLDKVRSGGIVAFVTSKGTMDKENPAVRKYIAERAELLGAIRLPNNAFKANAGTEVTSDIIFLQKRDKPISIEKNTPEWVYKDMLPNGIAVNKYFADNPHMILGEMVKGNKLYGNQDNASMCLPIDGADLKEQLAEAVKNINGTYRTAEKENSPLGNNSQDIVPCPPNAPKYSFIVENDILYYHKSDDTMETVKNTPKNIEQIKSMVALRDSIHTLLNLQIENTDGSLTDQIVSEQKKLNIQYDDFTSKYGRISSKENKKLFSDDNGYHLIKGLERLDEKGNYLGKADIFNKIVVNAKNDIKHCDNANDALIISLSEKLRVDLPYMSELTGWAEDKLISELGDKIYQNPQYDMRWESADEYLTGNIRAKLDAAKSAGMERNVEALNAVMPERISAVDISVKLGSAWVDPQYIRQFIIETLKPDYMTSKNISVTYSEATDKWKVEGWKGAYENSLASQTYGTSDKNAYEIIEATLNLKRVEIKERVFDESGNPVKDDKGRYVLKVNHEKTMLAQSKQDEINRKFQDWIFEEPDRRKALEDTYNEKFNSIRLREYDGSHLNFVGMNPAVQLKEHQKNAIARGLYSNGNTLLAHEVGAGKTFEMIATAMEGKRLGLYNKCLIAAPNALTEQWGDEFRKLYPNANVLVATEKDFKKENRRDLFAKIATGDWDAVVVGHSQFDMIHLSKEREIAVLNEEVAHLEAALLEIRASEDGGRSFSVKQIEKSIKNYEEKIKKLLEKSPEDDMLSFEKLGIDKIFIDESQNYKNLDTPTKMHNVSGIGSGGSGKSMQLLMKCRYLDEITGGRGTTFASGTPISNSMSEMYTLMRYLQADKLKEMGINSFDRWASVFGETVTAMELSPEGNGKYQSKTRFAKFQNLPELMNIFKECADVKTAESLHLDRPDYEMHNVNVPPTKIQSSMIKTLGERAKLIRSGAVKPYEDNMLVVTNDGRKIGLDQRCINPELPDDPNSKVNVCVNSVFDIWQKTAENRSTQMIFCDLATPQPPLNEDIYTIYRKDENGNYNSIYTATLGDKDTAEKILKKLNSDKAPKDFEGGGIFDGDIIVTRRINYDESTAYQGGFTVQGKKLEEISADMWERLDTSPVMHFDSERKFCVYDDIKEKLVKMGIPENEIAFIHDAEKTEDKQKLFDKMNSGDIRILIGSTQKCGAGMNAQKRMIALHDLDAPMRPSDMMQRHGRIIRQGNTNSKVDIYRYTTDRTFDAYLYQMLENKQKFISQIMTDKSPVRSCEDVDEAVLDYAEVKALCAGSPLIKTKIDLETEITKLNIIKSSFLSQKYALQTKVRETLPARISVTKDQIESFKADIETVKNVKPLKNDDGKEYYPVTVGDRTYHDKEEAGNALRQAVIKSSDITEGKERVIGSYRGLEISAFLDTLNKCVKFNLKGEASHYGELNMSVDIKAGGNIIRFDNVINNITMELQKAEEKLQSLRSDLEESKKVVDAPFPQEAELTEKQKQLDDVIRQLSSSEINVNIGHDLYNALIEVCPALLDSDELYCKYEVPQNVGIEPFIVERNGDEVFIAHTYIQNGDLMYDPAVTFRFDTEAQIAVAETYELSSAGIYQDFHGGGSPKDKSEVEDMVLNTLLENVKSYSYELTDCRDGRENVPNAVTVGESR